MTAEDTTAACADEGITAIPVLSCRALDDVLPFYTALGFEITVRQERPNPYAATRWQRADLHFYGLPTHDAERGCYCLMIVPEVEQLHERFREALRAHLGKVPSKGLPRITRMKPGQTRFTVVDPAGNSVLYIRRGEADPHEETKRMLGSLTSLGKAMRAAEVLRDFKNDDAAAAKVLRAAIAKAAKATDAEPDELARAKAMLAELDAG
jgi:hypothetical protein